MLRSANHDDEGEDDEIVECGMDDHSPNNVPRTPEIARPKS